MIDDIHDGSRFKANTLTREQQALKAIATRDLPKLVNVLRLGCNINARVGRDREMLLEKAMFAPPEFMVALLYFGADPNALCINEGTALSARPQLPGDAAQSELLMAMGGVPNEKDRQVFESYKRTVFFQSDKPVYAESVENFELPRPTPQSVQEEYAKAFLRVQEVVDKLKLGVTVDLAHPYDPNAVRAKPERPKEQQIHGTKRSSRKQAWLDDYLYRALTNNDRRYVATQTPRALESGAAVNGTIGPDHLHSPLFYAAALDSKYALPAIDLIWALGGRLNEADAEFFNIVLGHAETDNPQLARQAKAYPNTLGAQHLLELLKGERNPTVAQACAEHRLNFNYDTYLQNRPYESPRKRVETTQLEHKGRAQYAAIARDALSMAS